MGGNRRTIVKDVLIPEALPALAAGFTVTLVTLIGASAMAGAVARVDLAIWRSATAISASRPT